MNKRPTRHDEAIISIAAKSLAPEVLAWMSDPSCSVEDVQGDLEKSLRYNDDGYEIAKALERSSGYSPDSALVEILDGAYWKKQRALEEAEKLWVQETGAQEIPIESKVIWAQKKDAGEGIVTKNYPNGSSVVMFESLGHVREGQGSHGFVAKWEDLTVV